MRQILRIFWVANGIAFCCLTNVRVSLTQIVPDATLPNNSSITTESNTSTIITDGTQAGSNLFHSFEQFSVPTGNTAYFNNAPDIQNIISRVTGSSISNIDGLIRANGTANLFLINPNGFIFGPNASLNIGGSFLASTASNLNFADNSQFSATAPQYTPLLTVSVPIGLQFGATVGSILTQSVTLNSSGESVGLQVKPGKTLALVGGNITLQGGKLTAEQGRTELGSVAEASPVSLKPIEKGWILGYEGVQNFKDIQLSQRAIINTSGKGSGDIQVQGRRVTLTGGSQIVSTTLGSEAGGDLTVTASDFVELNGTLPVGTNPSGLFTRTLAAGKAGDITINTKKLTVRDGAFISTEVSGRPAIPPTGRGGNLTVIASDSVDLINGFLLSQTSAIGNAGDLRIKTERLIVHDGAVISASTFGLGNSGNIEIYASDIVNLFGSSTSDGQSSGLLTRTSGNGEGGNITINTSKFRVANGAIVDALTTAQGNGGNVTVTANTFEAINGGQVFTTTRNSGNAGNIAVNATDSVILSGSDPTFADRVEQFGRDVIDNEGSASSLLANTTQGSTGNGGNVEIKTGQLNVSNKAALSVSNTGTGNAGNLDVNANSIRLDNGGKLTATSASGEGGNIGLSNLDLLLLRGRSEISTDATAGTGNGGNINIGTDLLVGKENSDITATAVRGRGGNIQIDTQGIFGIEPRSQRTEESDITASSELGVDGVVEINRLDIDPSADLVVLPANIVDVSGLIAQGCPASGGSLARGGSEFVVSGRGGLPPNPAEATRSETTLADLGTRVQSQYNRASADIPSNSTAADSAPIVEAQSWMIGAKGEVVLTAQAPTVTPDIPWLTPTSCDRS